MNKLAIIGKGAVGTAVFEGMRHAFEILAYDKNKGWDATWEEDFSQSCDNPLGYLTSATDGPIFVCVPSPMKKDGSCDISTVEEVINNLNNYAKNRVVVIKSTVVPGTTEYLNNKYSNLRICFNPEFLREKTYIEDFKKQTRVIVGGDGSEVVKKMYQKAYPEVPVYETSSTIAEMVKYVENCFLATKVSFANEMKQICDALQVPYDKVKELAVTDERLGKSHWGVPGWDMHLGFGGLVT